MAPTTLSSEMMRMRRAAVVVVALASLLAVSATAGAVTFSATNAASSTAGGKRFGRDVGVAYSRRVLSDASSFCWNTFSQPSPGSRKPVSSVSLVVEDIGGVAFTSGNGIHLSAQYVGGYSGDVKTEVTLGANLSCEQCLLNCFFKKKTCICLYGCFLRWLGCCTTR